jgi:23S rRNA (adenine2503-C2)-methyltransferase
VLAFQEVLTSAGYSCFVRRRRGDDVSAACGQLVLVGAKPKVRGFRKASDDPGPVDGEPPAAR